MRAYIQKSVAVAAVLSGLSVFADAAVVCRVEMDRDVVFAGRRQTAVVKVTLDAPEAPRLDDRPPVNLSIVLDRSGSMSGQKIQKAREAAIEALRRLNSRDVFSLVTYDDNVQTVIPAQRVGRSSWMEERIGSIGTGGSTALFAGVSQGASEIRKHLDGEYIHRILLLSDGLANVGPDSPVELGRLGTALLKEGISVTTVGVGTDYNEDLMALMAQNSDGNTYFVESSRDLPRIFQSELGDVLSVVASKVVVEVQFAEGVRPLRFIGRDGRIGRNSAEISLNQLYGGQEKYALIEVELPESAEGEVRQVAEAHCRYQNTIANKPALSRSKAMVRFSGKPEEVEASVNVVVGKEVARNRMAIAQEQALISADNRDYDVAADLLRSNAQTALVWAAEYGDVELKEEALQLQAEADKMKRDQALPKAKRKLFKASSFSIRNQQGSAESQEGTKK
jgi:Ca-activated chloride channel homolog